MGFDGGEEVKRCCLERTKGRGLMRKGKENRNYKKGGVEEQDVKKKRNKRKEEQDVEINKMEIDRETVIWLWEAGRRTDGRERQINTHCTHPSACRNTHGCCSVVCIWANFKSDACLCPCARSSFLFHSHTLGECLLCSFTHIRNFFHQSSTNRPFFFFANHDWMVCGKGSECCSPLKTLRGCFFYCKDFVRYLQIVKSL